MSIPQYLLCLSVFCFYLNIIATKDITQEGNCKALLSDGTVIDLKSLDNPSKPLIDTQNGVEFQFNPCTNFACGDSGQSSICEKVTAYNFFVALGDANKVKITMPENSLMLTYDNDQYGASVIECKCTTDSISFKFINLSPGGSNTFTLSGTECCPRKPGSESGNGLSAGWILIIILISIGSVYLIVGSLYMFKFKNERGVKMIPNYNLWMEIPANIKDGFQFVLIKIKGKPSTYEAI